MISKWGIMSIEMMTALDNDMAVIHADGSKEYVDNNGAIEIDATVEPESAAFSQQDTRKQQDGAADPASAGPF